MRFIMVTLWVISVGGYLYNLFTTYGNMTPHISFPILGSFVSKDVYFFAFTGLFMAFAFVFYALNQVIYRLPNHLFVIPNKQFWLSTIDNKRALRYLLVNWNYAAATVVNYFCMYIMLIAEAENHYEGEIDNALDWFYKPGLVMFASLVLPFFRLMVSKVNFGERDTD